MNIYIYGDKSFKKDMTKILNENKLKQKVEQFCDVTKLDSVTKLKEAILADPTDIYLIDHNAIIVKNFFTTKIKILNEKEGIEEEFLKEHGIGDFSVDKRSDISRYILKRFEALGFIDNISKDDNLQDEEVKVIDTVLEDDQSQQDTILKELEAMEEEIVEDICNQKDGVVLPKNDIEQNNSGEENNMEELTQIDDINEVDLIEALSNIDGIDIIPKENGTKVIEVDKSKMDNVAALLEQLMNDKTLEISIKVKS